MCTHMTTTVTELCCERERKICETLTRVLYLYIARVVLPSDLVNNDARLQLATYATIHTHFVKNASGTFTNFTESKATTLSLNTNLESNQSTNFRSNLRDTKKHARVKLEWLPFVSLERPRRHHLLHRKLLGRTFAARTAKDILPSLPRCN